MKAKYIFVATYLMPPVDGKNQRTTCCIVAESFAQALDYFYPELNDPETEVESIQRFDPVVAIINEENRNCRHFPDATK